MAKSEGNHDVMVRHMPRSLWNDFKKLCIDKNVSLSARVIELVRRDVEQHQVKQQQK